MNHISPPKKRFRKFIIISAGVLGGLFILVFLTSVYFLRTTAGQKTVADFISKKVASPDFDLELKGLSGALPWRIHLDELLISDRQGVWLISRNINLDWRIRDIVSGRIRVLSLHTDLVDISRFPTGAEKKDGTGSGPGFQQISLPPITLEDLLVNQLKLPLPETTQPGVFRVSGKFKGSGKNAEASVLVDRLDGPTDHLSLTASVTGEEPYLKIDGVFKESTDGYVTQLAGMKTAGPIHIQIKGEGPLKAWDGHIGATLPGYGSADVKVNLDAADKKKIGLAGVIDPESTIIPEQLKPFAGSGIEINLSALQPEPKSFQLEFLTLKTNQVTARAHGRYSLDNQSLNVYFDIDAPQAKYIEKNTALSLKGLESLGGHVEGPLKSLSASLNGKISSITWQNLSGNNVQLRVEASGSIPGKGLPQDLAASGDITLQQFEIKDSGLAQEDVRIQFNAASADLKTVILNSLNVSGWNGSLAASGRVDTASSDLKGSAAIDLSDLSRLKPLLGVDMAGQARLAMNVEGRYVGPDLTADAEAHLSGLKELPADTAEIVGEKLDLKLSATMSGPDITLSAFTLRSATDVNASGSLDLKTRLLNLKLDASSTGLSSLVKKYGLTVSDPVMVNGRLTGPLSELAVNAEVSSARLEYGGHAFQDFQADALLKTGREMEGTVELTAEASEGKVSASSTFFLENNVLNIPVIDVRLPGTVLAGNLEISLASRLMDGDISLTSRNLSRLSFLTGQDMSGTLEARGTFQADNRTQRFGVKASAKALTVNSFRAGGLKLDGKVTNWDFFAPDSASLLITNAAMDEIKIKTLNVTASAKNGATSFSLGCEGSSVKPFNLKASGKVVRAKTSLEIALDTLNGHFDQYKLRLNRQALLTMADRKINLDQLDLNLASGKIQGAFAYGKETVDGRLALVNLPLEPVSMISSFPVQGRLNGTVSLSGSPSAVAADVALKAENLKPALPSFSNRPPLSVEITATMAKNALSAKLKATGLGKTPMNAGLEMPAVLTFSPFNFSIPESKPITGFAQGPLNLDFLPLFAGLDNQVVHGQADTSLNVKGTAASPVITGKIQISDASFENLTSGTVLRNISGRIEADGKRIRVIDLKATDGNSGRISAAGALTLEAEQGYPYNVEAKLDDAKLFRLDLVEALATGIVKFQGNTKKAELSGKINLTPVNVNIPERSNPDIVTIEVKEINGPPEKKKPEARPKTQKFDLSLNIRIDTPNRLYVRGKGLDSEWQGNLHVRGQASAPFIDGKLNIIRGRYEFLGRRFNLTTGTVLFTGNNPPKPVFNVIGQSKANDIVATIQISGSIDALDIQLGSEPALPKDEILARILFGRSLSKISPFQALTLAQAANELAGGGGPKLDLMGKTRDMFGLDQLEIKEGSQGGTAIGVGKYLNEKVYVEAEKGTKPGEDKVSVEIELTPSISLQSEVGIESNGGLSINWKKDY